MAAQPADETDHGKLLTLAVLALVVGAASVELVAGHLPAKLQTVGAAQHAERIGEMHGQLVLLAVIPGQAAQRGKAALLKRNGRDAVRARSIRQTELACRARIAICQNVAVTAHADPRLIRDCRRKGMKISERTVGSAFRVGQRESGNVGTAEAIDNVHLIVQTPGSACRHQVAVRELMVGPDMILIVVETDGERRRVVPAGQIGIG